MIIISYFSISFNKIFVIFKNIFLMIKFQSKFTETAGVVFAAKKQTMKLFMVRKVLLCFELLHLAVIVAGL